MNTTTSIGTQGDSEHFDNALLGLMENSPAGEWERISRAARQCKELWHLSLMQISDSVAGMLLGGITACPYSSGIVIHGKAS